MVAGCGCGAWCGCGARVAGISPLVSKYRVERMHGTYCSQLGFYKELCTPYFYTNPEVLEHMQTKILCLYATDSKVDLILIL